VLRGAATVATIAALAGGGCDLFRTGGNSDRGYFEIQPTTDLALGGQLTYAVSDFELLPPSGPQDIGFELLSVSDPDGVQVLDSATDGTVVVAGIGPGAAHVSFRARADGDLIEDGFNITVRQVTRLQLVNCGTDGVYLRGAPAPVSYHFDPGVSPTLKGRGLYPVQALPPDGAVLQPDAPDTEIWMFNVGSAAPSQVVLESTLPEDDAQLIMNIIDPSGIDGVAPISGTIYAGDTRNIDVLPRAAGRPVCSRMHAVVRSLTPSVCGFDHGTKATADVTGPTVALTFLMTGDCRIQLELADLGLQLAWQTVTATAAPASSGGGSQHHHDDD
jgi:hypothetical protein